MKREMLAAALAVLASASIVSAMGKVAPRAHETVGTTIPVGIHTRINLVSTGGNIVVTGVPNASDITVIATKNVWGRTPGKAREALAGLTVVFNTVGDALEVRTETAPDWDFTHQVEYYVTVPSSFRVEVRTGSGAVQVRRAREVDVTTDGGDIILSNVATVTANTQGGAVEVDSTSGPVDVHSRGGRVQVRVRGNIKPVYIQTVGGTVALLLPREVNADLAVSTSKGPIVTEGLTLSDARQSRYGVRGQISRGGVPVEVTTGSGGITITTRGVAPIAQNVFLRPVATTAPDMQTTSARPARRSAMPDTRMMDEGTDEGAVDAFLQGDDDMMMPEDPADGESEPEMGMEASDMSTEGAEDADAEDEGDEAEEDAMDEPATDDMDADSMSDDDAMSDEDMDADSMPDDDEGDGAEMSGDDGETVEPDDSAPAEPELESAE